MSNANFYIPILLGSARQGRWSEHAAKFVFGEAQTFDGLETELLDVRDFISSSQTGAAMVKEKMEEWRAKMKRADGLVIVSPEYNHGYPGELKLMLDQLYEEYNRKPVGICGVSVGALGGARVVEQLRLVVIELQMTPLRSAVYFSNVHSLFDGDGNIVEAARKDYQDRVRGLLTELLWYAEVLRMGREGGK